MKVQIALGCAGILLGAALMLTGGRMCRTSCWVDDAFRLFLPAGYESWAGGLPVVIVGGLMVVHAVWGKRSE